MISVSNSIPTYMYVVNVTQIEVLEVTTYKKEKYMFHC